MGYPAGASRLDAVVSATLAMAGVAVLAAWAWWRPDLPGAWWVALAGWALLGVWSAWTARRTLRGTLVWAPAAPPGGDGAGGARAGAWRWCSAARPQGVVLPAVRVVLDMGRALLLHAVTPDGLALWLWCQQGAAGTQPAQWLALRRALAARADAPGRSGIFGRPVPPP